MSFEMTFEGANRRTLPDTEWDGIPNCWSCKTEGFTTNGRGDERNVVDWVKKSGEVLKER